jgi:chaperonin GroES
VIKARGTKVLITPTKPETFSSSGLAIIQSREESPTRGVVLSVGSEVKEAVKENDSVIFKEYAGTEVEWEGEKYFILDISEILAVVA